MEVHPVLENRHPFHSRPKRQARPVPARVVERLLVLDLVPPVAVIAVVIARNVEEAAVLRTTPPVLRESRRSLMLLGRGANRMPARGNPVL